MSRAIPHEARLILRDAPRWPTVGAPGLSRVGGTRTCARHRVSGFERATLTPWPQTAEQPSGHLGQTAAALDHARWSLPDRRDVPEDVLQVQTDHGVAPSVRALGIEHGRPGPVTRGTRCAIWV